MTDVEMTLQLKFKIAELNQMLEEAFQQGLTVQVAANDINTHELAGTYAKVRLMVSRRYIG